MDRDHLSLQEIEWLAEGSRKARGASGAEAHIEEARRHLGGCEDCRWRVQLKETFQRRLEQLKAAGKVCQEKDCFPEETWRRLAADLLPAEKVAELLEHSIQCEACGLRWRQAIEDFAEDVTEQEGTQLTSLASQQEAWQQSLARRLRAAQSDRGNRAGVMTLVGQWIRSLPDPFAWRPQSVSRLALAYAAAAIVLLAASVWLHQTRRGPSVDQLIASAYTEQRPFELRIAGAAYGPVRQKRSGERSAFAQPASLLRAKYLIKERLAARRDDEALLAASGRVELLEGHYDEAIETFGGLADVHPDSPGVLTDLATAYFQRAEAGDRAVDYGQAIELLSRALTKSPDDPVTLFNRAIALEKMYAYNEAIRDWEHYLRVDPGGNWAAEAQGRLSELWEKMKARDKPLALLRSDPVAATPLLRARSTATFPAPWAASLDEEYLDIAVREWLPSLYVSVESEPGKVWQRDPAVWDALSATADVLSKHHRDAWLADLLHDLPADSASSNAVEHFMRALDFLARAVKANASGDPDSARPLAETASRSFLIAKCHAGYLRAQEEIIYSLARATRVPDCLRALGPHLRDTKLESYAWLNAQAILWDATCQGASGNLGRAQQLSERALAFTDRTGYADQHLRSVLFAAGFLRSTERNWRDTRESLQTFWTDLHNPIHAYESYFELALLAEEADKSHLALHMYYEALSMVERTPDRLFRAVAHYRLAMAAKRARDLRDAESEFGIASQQFAALPNSATTRFYTTVSEIDLAAVEIQQDRFESAAARLEHARLRLIDGSDTGTAFQYYKTLAQLYFRRRNLPEAEKELRSALRFGEFELNSVHTDADRLAWEREAAPAYRILVELYARKPDATTRALEIWEWYLASALRGPLPSAKDLAPSNLETGPSPRFLARIRSTVLALQHETVISFAYLPSGIAAWAFDNRGVNFVWISVSEEELARQVRNFARLCADPASDLAKLRQEGTDLYTWLLAPFERQLDPTRLLVIEPDSNLSDAPWPALVDPHGEYLGNRFAIVISPGLGYWLNLRSPTTISPEQKTLVVGMPTLASAVASRFSPLPDADHEARSVASHFRHSRLLSGKEVTSAIIRQELSQSKVFHFAGHAVSSTKQSGLVLASITGPDGNADEPTLLSGNDLEKPLLQRLQLVVLSACATAETEKGFAEPDTMVRGFLRAGVPYVVASRWPVDSHTTELTMSQFYSHLFEGLPAAMALQQSASTLRLQPATSHPYYWAAFGSYGR